MEHSANEERKDSRTPANSLVPLSPRPLAARPQRQVAISPESEAGLTPQRVLAAVRLWWKWALPAGLVLGFGASLAVYMLFVPKYEASAWVRIEERVPFLAFNVKNDAENTKGFVATQIELLRSPMVVRPVIAEPELATLPELRKQDNPVEWLRRQIAIERIGQSELYTVSFTCSQPKAAARAVNAIVDSYDQLRRLEMEKRDANIVGILDSQREEKSKEVEALRNRVREMAMQVTGRDPFKDGADLAPTQVTPLASLVSQLISTEVEETLLSAKLQSLESDGTAEDNQVPAAMIDAAVAQSPKVQQVSDLLAEQRLQLGAILTSVKQGKDSSEYKRAADRLARSQEAFEEMKKEMRSQAKARLEAQRAQYRQETLASLRADVENSRAAKKMLEERYAAELQKVERSTGDSVTLRFQQDTLAREEKVLDLISERLVALRTEQLAPQRVWEMNPADVPVAPVQAVPYLNMLIALVAGIVAPFGAAVLKEQMTGRVSDAEHVERNAYLTVLGEIAELPTRNARKDRPERRDHRAIQVFQESIENLRSSLLLGEHAESLRILSVSSAVNKEGKTSVAVQLAASIARAMQQRVLVIDGDLRDPGVHSVFDVPRMPGLSNVLSGECTLASAIVATRTELVDVLPAGFLGRNPHQLLQTGAWSDLLANISPEYRYIIVDSPPVLAASEALVLARSADAVLVCAMRDVTRLAQLKKATQRVLSAGAKVAGLVLSGIPASQYTGRYGSYFHETD